MISTVSMMCPIGATADASLRSALLDYYLANATSAELTEWLRDIDRDARGTVEEKRARVRAHTKYLAMPPADFPEQTLLYLAQYSAAHLEGICDVLKVSADGTRDMNWRRIMRTVAYREGWLSPPGTLEERAFTMDLVRPFVDWHLIAKRGNYERDFYRGFGDDMEEIFGEIYVHEQLPVASGTTLKIDFHIGHPQRGGVGIEFKMPTSNADLQRAWGQIDQYQARYGTNLLVVLLRDFIGSAQLNPFIEKLAEKGVALVVK